MILRQNPSYYKLIYISLGCSPLNLNLDSVKFWGWNNKTTKNIFPHAVRSQEHKSICFSATSRAWGFKAQTSIKRAVKQKPLFLRLLARGIIWTFTKIFLKLLRGKSRLKYNSCKTWNCLQCLASSLKRFCFWMPILHTKNIQVDLMTKTYKFWLSKVRFPESSFRKLSWWLNFFLSAEYPGALVLVFVNHRLWAHQHEALHFPSDGLQW